VIDDRSLTSPGLIFSKLFIIRVTDDFTFAEVIPLPQSSKVVANNSCSLCSLSETPDAEGFPLILVLLVLILNF
jgi:hypothetical protein